MENSVKHDPGNERIEQRFGSRFHATRILRSARGITTYYGRDRQSGGAVVIKTAREADLGKTARARLDYEVALLNRTRRFGSSIEVQVGAEGGLVYYVRPFLEGISLAEKLARRRLDSRETALVGAAILRRLAEDSLDGVLHRHIKPSNIILGRNRPELAELVDYGLFGLVDSSGRFDRPSLVDSQYLSPEHFGSILVPVDARSDLYSLGVVLYEALAGRPPFRGESVGEILRQHLVARPVPLETLAPDTARGLVRIVARLLRKDPRDRYQTAAGALVDLEDLARALAAGVEEPEIVVGARDVRAKLTEPAFIGRSDELAALEEGLASARRGRGGLVLVEGESGRGKTWLLAEIDRRATALGARVLHGHGMDRVAPRPYHVLADTIGELIAKVSLEPGWGRAIIERLGPFAAAACASVPKLRAMVPGDGRASLGPEDHGESRSLEALAALIDAVGSVEQPVVILIDDAQWADSSTIRLLERWQERPPQDRGRHVIIVLALRPEEISADHPLLGLRSTQRIHLAEFGAEEVRRQVASMAGRLPEDAVEAILEHAGGNPFLVSATLFGMVEVGGLSATSSGWQINPERMAELQTAEHSAHILSLRLARLGSKPRRLLSVAALLGRTFDPVLAGALAGLEPRESIRIAEESRGSLLWAGGSGTLFAFVHDSIREALLEGLTEEQRRRLHRRAAETIEDQHRERVFELAYHFDASGDPERALPYAFAAAEQARNQFALDLAERYYRIAARGAAGVEPRLELRSNIGLGDVLALHGRYADAVEHYRRALLLARSKRERAEVEQRWSMLEMKRGDMDAACDHAEEALRLIGERVPRSRALLAPWTLWEALVQVLHSYFPKWFVRSRRGGDREDELFAIDIYHGLNGPYFFSRPAMWTSWAHLRLINLAERYPGSRALGRAYAAHAVSLNGFPRLFERGLRISAAGAELCDELGDLWGQAQGLTFHAMMLYYLGRFSEAVEVGRRAARLFDRTGDRWEANSGLDFAVDALVRMGDLRAAVLLAREIWQRGLEIGDSHALAWSLDAWSRATDGRIDGDKIEIARARARDLQTALAVAQADGVRLIGEGRPAEAAAVLEAARERNMQEAGYFYELNTPLLTYLATALRQQAEKASPWNPKERERLLARAEEAVAQALSVARRFRLNLPHALRESAFVSAMAGKPKRARRAIEESIAVAEELGERYELAQSRVARAELGTALGWTAAARDLETALRELEVFRARARSVEEAPVEKARVTLSLIDRFSTVLESGRAIATALRSEEIYARVRRAALLLLRGEHCVVLECEGEDPELEFVPVHGDVGIPCSARVIRRTFEEDRSIIVSGAEALDDPTSQRSAVRSVLGIPIRVRGKPYACVYVTHGELESLFGDDERRIGDFLGTLAGAAIENAEGFAKVKSFSREMEARVEERTRQLARANEELEGSLRQVKETQEQLVQAGKMAALGTLLAGLSHELNNPLAVILGYVQVLLRMTDQDDRNYKPLKAIERQTLRCSRLTRSLLEYSRAKPATPVRTDPEALCSNVLQLVEAEARDHEVELRMEIPKEPLPDIRVSLQEIETALINFLSNGVDATPPGGTVVLAARPETREGVPGILFAVRDTGSGISPAVLPRIFDPFFTTKPVGHGTGLGLSIAHRAVLAHKGRVDVHSVEGEGTTFAIWLPADAAQPAGELGSARLGP